ncbi:acetyl-CoA acetyltransferase [Novosphingobium tardum]|uniref:Acetyl-CoA acetyltransferase n=1 Tax=Novosphingobium tardum TaxID=1538021 RepID=A0ABV8RKK0_9SPHN
MTDPERIPVIVGVGQVNDRPADPAQGLDSLALMVAALRAADEDAGGGWLADCDALAVVDQIAFRDTNPLADKVAWAIGAAPRHCEQTPAPMGDSPVRLLHEAANRIAAGQSTIAAVTGGEALRTAAQRAALAAGTQVSADHAVRNAPHRKTPGWRARYGLSAPVDVYPLYENGCRAAWGQSLEQAQAESGTIWALMSQVADRVPAAWIHKPVTAEEVIEPTAANRPIAHPYTKFMVANSSVNQGAGFLVTSLGEARRRGVPEERLVYVGMGAAAHEPDDILSRDRYDASAGMTVSISRTMELNGLSAADLDHVELYSCFPCVPKMARRVLDWPLDRPATVFGGLTFGGGPIGNYMSHAVAEMVLALRRDRPEAKGLLFANGGFATHNHSLVVSRAPLPRTALPQDFDFQAEADAMRRPVPPLVEDYEGAAVIESYTVLYARDGSVKWGVIVARTADDRRTLARVPASDAETIAFLVDGKREPLGTPGRIVAEGDDRIWVRAL